MHDFKLYGSSRETVDCLFYILDQVQIFRLRLNKIKSLNPEDNTD